jgi:uncharacterized protein (TIGR03437 family)
VPHCFKKLSAIDPLIVKTVCRLSPLALALVLCLAPAVSGQSFTMPSVVYSGVPFNVTVTSSDSLSSRTLTWDLNSCTCSVSPASIVYAGRSQTYQLTVTGSPDNNVVLQLVYGNTLDHENFAISVATAQMFVVNAPASSPTGTSFNVTITATDNSGNIATGFNLTVTVTSSDPLHLALGTVSLTNGTASFSTTLSTAGNQTITALREKTTGSATILITALPVTRFRIDTPSGITAGEGFAVTITALDANGNPVTGYSGTVTLTSTDPQAPALGTVTLTNGTGTLSSAIVKTAGTQTITGTAPGGPTGTSGTIAVTAGAATALVVSAPATVPAGTSFNVTVTARDAFGNTASYAPTVTLSSTDPQASGMGAKTLSGGSGSFATTPQTAGTQRITATGSGMPSISGFADVSVLAASATRLAITAPSTATAGTAFTYAVTAKDQYNNLVPTYSGTIHFTSTDGQAALSGDSTLSNGAGTFQATLKTAGSFTITATDTATSSISGVSGGITVVSGPLTQFVFTPPTQNQPAGSSFSIQVTALGPNGSIVTSYTGSATLTSSDPQAILPSPATLTFTNGTASTSVTLKTAGNQTLTVADGAISNFSSIVVQSAAATRIDIAGVPLTTTAGQPFSFTATAKDASGNVATQYAGTLTFSSGDPLFASPPDSPLPSGAGTFQATLTTAGSWTVTTTDTGNASIRGTSGAINVVAGAFDHFLIEPVPTEVTAGVPFNFTVTAKDAFNNTITNYSGAVTVTGSDPAAVLPSGLTFINGAATGMATFKTAGGNTLTATAASASVLQSVQILVDSAPPNSIQIVSGDGQQKTINTTFALLVVRIVDAFQNPIRGWQVTFTPPNSGASATFSGGNTVLTGSDGQTSIPATANQIAGSYTVQVTASDRPERLRSTPSVSFSLTNLPGPPATLETSGTQQTAQAGSQFTQPLLVTVKDAGGNPIAGASVTFTLPSSSGASASLSPPGPAYMTNSSGQVSVIATANATTGSYSITASVTGGLFASFQMTNLAVPPGSLTITGGSPQSATVSTAFSTPLQVLIKDASGMPLNSVAVVFSAIVGTNGASAGFSADAVHTDPSGVASITAHANSVAGSYQVQVVAATGGSGTFNLTNTPGAPGAIQVVSGTPQSTPINLDFSDSLRVRVVDQLGNGISGAMVTYTAPESGASASLSSSTATDEQGYTQVTATANITAGTYFVSATASGISTPAAFSLQNVLGPTPALVSSAGSPQSIVVGSVFPQLLQVAVRDSLNNPIPNVTVFFSSPATGASASLSALLAITDAQGQTSVRATANTAVGAYQVEASAPGISAGTTAFFSLTNTPGPVASVTPDVGTSTQSTRVTAPFPNPLRVTAADSYGHPVPGVTLTFSVPGSGQSAQLSNTTVVTDSSGAASVTAVANSIAGSYAVAVSATDGVSATFNLTNTAGPPATVESVSNNLQNVTVGSPFAPLVVVVRDANGNPLSGQTLTISLPAAGASATAASATVTTDANGQGSFNLTANTMAGNYAVAVTGAGVASPAIFKLGNTAGVAAGISLLGGGSQSAFTGYPFVFPLRVLVQDTYGNPVGGATVNYAAPSTAVTAQLFAQSTVTDPYGQASASAIAGPAAGTYVVVANIPGLAAGTASFNLTNVPFVVGNVVVVSGSGQSAPIGTSFIDPLIAAVLDPRGNPIPGVTVIFAVPPSGPSAKLSVVSGVTNDQGIVSATALANATAGAYQVVATADGYSGSAVFSLQNTTPAPDEPTITSIVNAASFIPGASPGSLQTVFGANLATATATAGSGTLPLTLGGVTVTIAGRQVPLLYVSPTQINFQVPPDTSLGRGEIIVSQSATLLAKAALQVNPSAPGIFRQIQGDPTRAAALNQDYTPNNLSSPASAGTYVLMFLTGSGAISPAIAAGQPAPFTPLSNAQLTVNATIGPRPVTIQFAGRAPGLLGDQVNLLIPADLPTGDYPVVIRVDGVLSNSVLISVSGAVGGTGMR